MAEDYTLTDPIVKPVDPVAKLKVVGIVLDLVRVMVVGAAPGFILITLQDNLNVVSQYTYEGQVATNFIKFLNTGNFSTQSMQKKILQRLQTDGKIPPGTVTGAPD